MSESLYKLFCLTLKVVSKNNPDMALQMTEDFIYNYLPKKPLNDQIKILERLNRFVVTL